MSTPAIAAFPAQPTVEQRVVVGTPGVELRVRATYRERTASWYLDVFDVDGNDIARGRRLSSGWFPLEGLALTTTTPGLPRDIVWAVQGPSPYVRGDLGTRLHLFLLTEAELAAVPRASSGDGVTIEVV